MGRVHLENIYLCPDTFTILSQFINPTNIYEGTENISSKSKKLFLFLFLSKVMKKITYGARRLNDLILSSSVVKLTWGFV